MKKMLLLFLIQITLSVYGHAETQWVCLGRIDLAGMVPDPLPAPGSFLTFQSADLALQSPENLPVGFIPGRFRQAIQEMQTRGLNLEFQVVHVYSRSLPGKYLTVEIGVRTDNLNLISPLIYSIPVYDDFEMASVTEE